MVKLTIEQLRQQARDIRKAAKELRRKMQEVTDPEERKQLARQMNDLFTQASELRNEAKHRHWFEQSIEREFISIKADLDED